MNLTLITGGIKRIGRVVAQAFLAKGHHVIIHVHHHDTQQQQAFLQDYPAFQDKISFIAGDLTDMNQVQTMAQTVCEEYGVPDNLIHTASLFEKDSLQDFSWQEWQRHRAIHVDCMILWINYFFQKRQQGQKISITLLIDQRTQMPTPEFFSYTASKIYLESLIPLLAVSTAPFMRINGISPGPVLKNYRQSDEDFQQQILHTPLQQQVLPTDLAKACVFLAECDSVTGQILTIDSGQHLEWRTEAFCNIKE